MWRERGGAVAVGTVASACISLKAVSEEGIEPLLCGCFARIPALAQAAGPIGMPGLEVPVLERLARHARDRCQPFRSGQGAAHPTECLQPAPERGEDAQASFVL